MTTYSKSRRHYQSEARKIYKNAYGNIPIDNIGKTYDIHHIDGNFKNNDISNLKAVSIQEHYDIHYSQGDWKACNAIAIRMDIPKEILSDLSSKSNKQRVTEGTHHFVGDTNPSKKRVKDGTHNLFGGEMQRRTQRALVAAGNHILLGGKLQRKRVADGLHHFLGSNINQTLLANGTHISQITFECPHCHFIGNGGAMKRWHFNKCKKKRGN